MLPFGPLEPDKQETHPGISMVAQNLLPLAGGGYGPLPGLSTPTGATALSGAPRGLTTLVLRDGSYKVFGFTSAKIEELQSDYTWLDIGAGYTCTPGDDWSSGHFGDKLLATNTTDGMQAYDVEAGGAVSTISDAGAPREIFVTSNMVVGLDCLDRSGVRNNRLIRNCAFGDHTNWETNGADYQPLQDGEELICGRDLKNGAAVIFQKNAMRLMQFGNAGGGALYSLPKIAGGRGSIGAKSVVSFDGAVYWLATNGFWRFSLNGGLEPIGSGRIDEWFFDRVDQSSLSGVQGSIDPFRKIVWWRWPSSTITSDEVFDDIIGYSWAYDRWVTGSIQTTYLGQIASPAYTLATLDSAFGTLADIPDIGLGDRFFQGGESVFAALDNERKFAPLNGSNLAATCETMTINSPKSGKLTSLTLLGSAQNATIQIGTKDALSDSIDWISPVSIESSGEAPVAARGKNMRVRVNVAAGEGWDYVKGVDHFSVRSGGRR